MKLSDSMQIIERTGQNSKKCILMKGNSYSKYQWRLNPGLEGDLS